MNLSIYSVKSLDRQGERVECSPEYKERQEAFWEKARGVTKIVLVSSSRGLRFR